MSFYSSARPIENRPTFSRTDSPLQLRTGASPPTRFTPLSVLQNDVPFTGYKSGCNETETNEDSSLVGLGGQKELQSEISDEVGLIGTGRFEATP